MTKILSVIFLLVFSFASAEEAVPSVSDHLGYWVKTLKSHPLKLVRKNAARTLGKMGSLDAVEPLMDATKDVDRGVRLESIRSLGLLGDDRAASVLSEIVAREKDSEVRKAASEANEKIKAHIEYTKEKEAKAARVKER